MRNRILTALTLSLLAVMSAIPAGAAMRTKLTLTVSNSSPVKVSEDLIAEDGTFSGTVESRKVFTDSQGRRTSETHTLFTNRAGIILMSADVRITSESDDFTALTGESFSQIMSVDTVIELYDSAYYSYTYSLDVDGLPEWLKVSGATRSDDVIGVGVNEYHHEFVISGTPETSHDMAVTMFTALVYVSGDYPALLAAGSKDVNISARKIPKPPDKVPKSEDISPEVIPKPPDISPDVVPKPPDTVDTGGNGAGTSAVSLAEIVRNMTAEQKSAVKVLKVNANVTDLTGLEEFTNLERLDLKEAVRLETVDLSGNSSVKSVDISGNMALKTLTLTGSKVEVLDVSSCENLVELNVAGCETLRLLNVSYTPIKTLNVEGCTGLEVLNCSHCGFEDLTLTGCVSLNILDCSYNNLHRLDVYMLARLNELKCEHQTVDGPAIGLVLDMAQYFDGISASSLNEANDSGVENVINLRAFDSSGREISAEYDRDTGIARFGEIPAKMTYDYITGFEDVNMDVTVFAAERGGIRGVGSNSGGCNAEFALSVLLTGLVLAMLRKKR